MDFGGISGKGACFFLAATDCLQALRICPLPFGPPRWSSLTMLRRATRRPVAVRRPNQRQRRLFLETLEDRRLLAAVTTNKPDYFPGEIASFSASGFPLGE